MKYRRFVLSLLGILLTGPFLYDGSTARADDGFNNLESEPEIIIAGCGSKSVFSGPVSGGAHIRLDLVPARYPLPAGRDPAYEYLVNPPILTDRIRYMSNDETAHVTEIRLFESGMPFYPDVMSETDPAGMINYALNAPVTASSRWAEERHERRTVDGSLDFESRWVSKGSPPHWLVIDLKSVQTIGCIQMVSGYMSGAERLRVAEDFRFEYHSKGEWHEMPGSGRQAGLEPSSMAITLSSESGTYSLTHRQEAVNWTLSFVPASGSPQSIESIALPAADVIQGSKLRLELLVTGQTAVFVVNGHAVYSFDHTLGAHVSVGVESLSADVELQLYEIQADVFSRAGSSLPGDVRMTARGSRIPPFRFHPFRARQDYALASDEIKEITLSVIPAVAGQQIMIMGQPSERVVVDTSGPAAVDVPIEVVSADRSETRTYHIRITPVPPRGEYVLSFSDEFDGNELDLSKWSHRTGSRWESTQRAENISVEDGKLAIRLEVDDKGRQYTGGIISNEGFLYGYYEARVRLWKHHGWHSAFWQMQSSGVLVNEIDGFESVRPNRFTTNLHYYRPRHVVGPTSHDADVASGYNIFGWEWLPGRVRFYFNGTLIRESDYPGPHLPANVWLSCVAHPNASTADLPGTISFDYFRYYRPADSIEDTLRDALIVDTRSIGYTETGTWHKSESAVSPRQDFETRVSRQPNSTATWSTSVEHTGLYEIFVWNPYVFQDGTLSETVFRIAHADGESEQTLNPMRDGQGWVSLGQHRFSKETPAMITLHVSGTRPHRAAAVALCPIDLTGDRSPRGFMRFIRKILNRD